ncbi:hypothetical protein GOV03_03585 [Candidatus Woesearchaeota archaeon]|nr:hypothetical protein [Candidatus Woesearchaeota archaeon]
MRLNKKGIEETSFFNPFPPLGKKGMEMWQLVMIIIVLILLLVVMVWYGGLGGELSKLFESLGKLL